MYAGKQNQQAFAALAMSIPMFRAMKFDIADLDQRVKKVETRVQKIDSEIVALARNLADIARQLECTQRQMLIQATENARLKKRVEQLEIICANDPLMVGLPTKNKPADLLEDLECIVGPCWGSDFDDVVFEVLKMKKIDGQRQSLKEMMQRWSKNPYRAEVAYRY